MEQFLFVVVLYGNDMSQSSTMCSLLQKRELLRDRGVHILVVDNTPGIGPETVVPESEIEYVAFGENRGLASAYQFAFLTAQIRKCRFIVLLDQDSEITSGFICALDNVISDCEPDIGIWCPDVFSCGKPISPYSLNVFGWPNFTSSRSADVLYGINSFSIVNMNFMEHIGGFEVFYWLDCLDLWLYEKARLTGWKIRRLNTQVNHDLSLVSGKISLARLTSIAYFETCFAIEYGTVGRIMGTVVRLGLRGIRQKQHIGGIYNYGAYLLEVLKGIRTGLKRRSTKKKNPFKPASKEMTLH